MQRFGWLRQLEQLHRLGLQRDERRGDHDQQRRQCLGKQRTRIELFIWFDGCVERVSNVKLVDGRLNVVDRHRDRIVGNLGIEYGGEQRIEQQRWIEQQRRSAQLRRCRL